MMQQAVQNGRGGRAMNTSEVAPGGWLHTTDVRALVRIVHDLHDEAVPLSVRLKVMLQGLCRLTGSRQCSVMEVDTNRGRWPMRLKHHGEFGFMDDADLRTMRGCLQDHDAVDELAMRLAREGSGGVATRTAHSVVGREMWRRTRQYDRYLRPVGVEDILQSRSAVPLGPGKWGWIGMVRDRSQGAYQERDSTLLHTLSAEIDGWLWARIRVENGRMVRIAGNGAAGGHAQNGTNGVGGVGGAGGVGGVGGVGGGDGLTNRDAAQGAGWVGGTTMKDMLGALSPAQQRVLPYLLRGCREEEIAQAMKRSRHTVHDHAKKIYDALGVNSRVELVLMFQKARGSELVAEGKIGAAEDRDSGG